MADVAYLDRPTWWREIVDQFQALRRELAARAPETVTISCAEEYEQLILAIKIAAESAPVLRLVARCEEEVEERTLVLNIDTDEGSEELLRLVWYGGQEAHAASKTRGSNRRRGLNTTADEREGPLAEGDVIALLREQFLSFVMQLQPCEEEAREVTVWKPKPPAASRQAADVQAPNAKVITLPVEKRQEDDPATARRSTPTIRPTLVPLTDAERADFENAEGLYRDFALACRGALQPGDIAPYAQRVLELMVTRQRAELEACDIAAAAGIGMKGALKLFGVAVAFGVEIAAATFGFGAWLKRGWEGAVYALTGVGLIGGGLVPITKGQGRRLVMKVAVAWSIAVAALTMQNPELVEPLQEQMRVFHQIDPVTELRLTNARSKLHADEERKRSIEAELKSAQAGYLGARRNADEPRRDFREGEKKREEAVKALQTRLEQQDLTLKADRDQLAEAEQAWHGAVLTDWTRYVAAGIVFAMSAIVGALGPIYLGLWLDERQSIHRDSLAARRARHTLKTRTVALEKNESTQRAEVRHIVASMRAYYADLLVRQHAPDPHAELDRVFREAEAAVEIAVRGFRRARSLQP